MKLFIALLFLVSSQNLFAQQQQEEDFSYLNKNFFCKIISDEINGSEGDENHPTPAIFVDTVKCIKEKSIKLTRFNSVLTVAEGEAHIMTPLSKEKLPYNSLYCKFAFTGTLLNPTLIGEITCQQ